MKTAPIARGELRMRLTRLFPEGLLPAESLEFTFEEFQTFSFRNQTPHFFTVYVGIAAEFAPGSAPLRSRAVLFGLLTVIGIKPALIWRRSARRISIFS
ncbi:hypothetical protein CTI14_13525 [Methylobacterium radiotolerans]|nr:hypothetical protein CTI14_13525 [Methylobacterium radiotolerans]